jgi:hypothetical protein
VLLFEKILRINALGESWRWRAVMRRVANEEPRINMKPFRIT